MPEKQKSTIVGDEKESESVSCPPLQALLGFDNRITRLWFGVVLAAVFLTAALAFFLLPPSLFVPQTTFVVKEGSSLGEVSLALSDSHLIRSRVLFEFCAITLRGDKKIMAGEYLFQEPAGPCTLAERITGGIFGIPVARVTLPEGLSNKEISVILAKALPHFDATAFLDDARSNEGYLFPDTYFFPQSATPADVVARLKLNFSIKIKPFTPDLNISKHSLRDILTMASLLEKEVATDEDRAIVSGILWKRIDKSIPLQVDAPFMYLLGKKSSELTQADLKINSAYNTYRKRGLPAGPINNPGISSMRAALHPTDSPYLYYLADSNGVTHYAKTFDEHKANKQKYLR